MDIPRPNAAKEKRRRMILIVAGTAAALIVITVFLARLKPEFRGVSMDLRLSKPRTFRVYVTGQVKNPGALTWYKDLTLLRAIAKQGGFSQWARKEKVDILRDDGKGGTVTLRVDARAVEKGETEDPALHPNDHIVVNERKFL